jgi:TRAP-type C4-dicarboxylate transport system substrate-binding protein
VKNKISIGLICILVVILLVCIGFTGCTTESTTTTTQTSEPTTSTSEPTQEVLKLKFSCDFQPFEPPGINGEYFCNKLEELSGGKIEIERFFGGQLGSAPEQLGLVKSGAVDIATFFIDQFPSELPLISIIPYDIKSKEYSVEKMYKLEFEIPETSALFQEEQTKQNIKVLNTHCIGESGILSKEVATSFADLEGKKIGQFLFDEGYAELGLVHVTVQVPEMYEALSRGQVDCIGLPPSPMFSLKMYEVCKSYVNVGVYTAAIPIVVNLDMWNSLTPEMQGWFEEAAQASMENSVSVDNEQVGIAYAAFEEAGLVVTKLPEADTVEYFELMYTYDIEQTWMNDCKNAGVEEEAEIIKEYYDDLTTWSFD